LRQRNYWAEHARYRSDWLCKIEFGKDLPLAADALWADRLGDRPQGRVRRAGGDVPGGADPVRQWGDPAVEPVGPDDRGGCAAGAAAVDRGGDAGAQPQAGGGCVPGAGPSRGGGGGAQPERPADHPAGGEPAAGAVGRDRARAADLDGAAGRGRGGGGAGVGGGGGAG